jgi:hypothetical protein
VKYRRIQKLLLLVLAPSMSLTCGGEPVNPGDESEKFSGILIVDAECNIIGGDTTDFQPRSKPGEPEILSLKYACPNPAVGKSTWIHWAIPQQDSVWLYAYDTPGGDPIDTLYSRTGPPGSYSCLWAYSGPAGIYRIRMFTESGFTSYGDVMLVE